MQYVTHKYKDLAEPLRLDAEYYVIAQEITKRYNKLLSKNYEGFKTFKLEQYFEIRNNDIPETSPVLVIQPSTSNKINYQIVIKPQQEKRYYTTIVAKTKEVSVFDIFHFLNYKEVQDYLSLQLKGAVLLTLSNKTIKNLRIPKPKISLGVSDIKTKKGTIQSRTNEFTNFITLYYEQYLDAMKRDKLIAATMLAGAISEAILYQFLIDCNITKELLEQRGLGGLIRDVKLGKFHEQEGKKFSLEPFEELNNIRNDIVHPSRAIFKLKTDYELISKSDLTRLFGQIKRNFGF